MSVNAVLFALPGSQQEHRVAGDVVGGHAVERRREGPQDRRLGLSAELQEDHRNEGTDTLSR